MGANWSKNLSASALSSSNMTREGCKKKEEEKEEEEKDKKEQGEGEKTQVRRWNVFRNLLVEGDNHIFAKLLKVVQRRWSLAVKVLNSKEIQSDYTVYIAVDNCI